MPLLTKKAFAELLLHHADDLENWISEPLPGLTWEGKKNAKKPGLPRLQHGKQNGKSPGIETLRALGKLLMDTDASRLSHMGITYDAERVVMSFEPHNTALDLELAGTGFQVYSRLRDHFKPGRCTLSTDIALYWLTHERSGSSEPPMIFRLGCRYGAKWFLGARRDSDFAKFTEAEVAQHLEHPELEILPYHVEPASWLPAAEREALLERLSQDEKLFTTVCVDLLQTDNVTTVSWSAAAELPVPKADAHDDVVICTPQEYPTAIRKAYTMLGKTPWNAARVRLLTPTDAAALLTWRPWVWSKHFGQKHPFHVVRGDREHLERVLFGKELTEAQRTLLIPHSIFDAESVRPGRVREIIGIPGSGKTTLAYQLLVQRTDWVITIVFPAAEGITACVALMTALPRAHAQVLLIENAHEFPTPALVGLEQAIRSTNSIAGLAISTKSIHPSGDEQAPMEPSRIDETRFAKILRARVHRGILLYLRSNNVPIRAYLHAIHEGTASLLDFIAWLEQLEAQRQDILQNNWHPDHPPRSWHLELASQAAETITIENPHEFLERSASSDGMPEYESAAKEVWRWAAKCLFDERSRQVFELLGDLARCNLFIVPEKVLTDALSTLLILPRPVVEKELKELDRLGYVTRVTGQYALFPLALLADDASDGHPCVRIGPRGRQLIDYVAGSSGPLRAKAVISFADDDCDDVARYHAVAALTEDRLALETKVALLFLVNRKSSEAFVNDLLNAPVSRERRNVFLAKAAQHAATIIVLLVKTRLEITERLDRLQEEIGVAKLELRSVGKGVCEAISHALSTASALSNEDVLDILKDLADTREEPLPEIFYREVQRQWTPGEQVFHDRIGQIFARREYRDSGRSFAELFAD